MNLDMLACRDMPPWHPSPRAHDIEAWHRYDYPMAGTFEMEDTLVLFTLIGDTSERLSVWGYIPMEGTDRAKVEGAEFDSPTQMREFIENLFAGREAAFALAKDLRIWRWTRQHVQTHDGLLLAATSALSEIVRSMTENEPTPPDVLFQAELAQAEVTTEDLVDA